jgi:transcriptional regulator with XRE-family HTH domain
LKAGRLRQRLTIKALSEDPSVGVSATFLSRIERSDALPSEELLVKLAQRLQLDPSELLLQLYSERAAPEVRPFVPNSQVLKLKEDLGARRLGQLDGLEALTDPIAQILDTHRRVLEENSGLRESVGRLRNELADKNRDFLPAVNSFLVLLFHYECETVRRETFMEPNGDATVRYTLEGIRPRKGMAPIRGLSHSIFIPQAPDELRDLEAAVSFQTLDKPASLEVDYQLRRSSPERAALEVNFPNGFGWSGQDESLSYHFSYRLTNVFATTLEDAHARYGRSSMHAEMLEWASCFINKPVRTLEVAVHFPPGYRPKYVDRWVWWMDTSFLETDYNLADKLILQPDEGISIESEDPMIVRLRVQNPLLGFNYGVVWQPLSKLELLRAARG